MLEIRCMGTPREIGITHGRLAKQKIDGSVNFYSQLFQKSCSMSWPEILEEATRYVESLEKIAPRYLEEIRGIAEGSQRPFMEILALNVRTEINFGLFSDKSKNIDVPSDGCTALGLLSATDSFLCQNWDWNVEQAPNLLVCHISRPGTGIPDISMVTEAGIIGKIGLNSAGVGCCLNAIRCRGVDRTKLPIHLALRTALESASREDAIRKLKSVGIAGSGHIMIGDPTGSAGLECASTSLEELQMEDGRLFHTNHFILDHPYADEVPWLPDSRARLERIRKLTSSLPELTTPSIFELFKDEDGYPGAINRKQEDFSTSETLFNIVMNLNGRIAQVSFGRPTESSEQTVLTF